MNGDERQMITEIVVPHTAQIVAMALVLILATVSLSLNVRTKR